jgi:hypothetical protein
MDPSDFRIVITHACRPPRAPFATATTLPPLDAATAAAASLAVSPWVGELAAGGAGVRVGLGAAASAAGVGEGAADGGGVLDGLGEGVGFAAGA